LCGKIQRISGHGISQALSQDFETLDFLDTVVICLDSNGSIVHMNSAAETCLQAGKERAVGKPLGQFLQIPPELDAVISSPRGAGASSRLHEIRLAENWFDCTIQNVDGNHWLLELHNLEWEQKRLRLQQREVQTGMLHLLSRNLGHEIRNPLGGIRGAAQMLADESPTEELATLARLIMRESDRIDELMLSFGQPELKQGEFDLYRLLDEVLELLQVEFGDQVEWIRDFDPSIPLLPGDASAIRQVVLNLARNACQAQSSKVVLRTRIEYDNAVLQAGSSCVLRLDFIDDGAGVPESLRQLLFLPLVTGRRSGTGLGLALSQQIASAHDGLLTYESGEIDGSTGSRFSLYLPVNPVGSSH
jgi:two-component system nitrogen regulation sensor histidine kinase GlnL